MILYKDKYTTLLNGDCFNVMSKMVDLNIRPKIILTSPPYNTGRNQKSQRARDNHEGRYDLYSENKSNEAYLAWTRRLFNWYDNILKENGVILYNLSYGGENPDLLWLIISNIIQYTNFKIADCIVWKKSNALPNNASPNKITRITEFVFVICRKSEYKTFHTNKKVKSTSSKGQNFYENIYNFIEAPNTSWKCPLNKAIFSKQLVNNLLDIYYTNGIIYDPFSGSGTTLVTCKERGIVSIGSELSKNQCEFASELLKKT